MRSGVILDSLTESSVLSNWSRSRCKALQTHLNNLRDERADKAVYRIVHYMGYGDYLKEKEVDESKIPILEAIGVSEPNPLRLLERLDELATIVQKGVTELDCQFILSTIHSSKGLEYEKVYLMDVADNILPSCTPVTPGTGTDEELRAYEEERRLFYVGMTRAKQELSIFRFQLPTLHSTFTEELFPKQPEPIPAKRKATAKPARWKPAGGSPAERQKIQQASAEFVPGDSVKHAQFGEGIITTKQGDIVSIQFSGGKVKCFSLSVALGQKQLVRKTS